MRLGPSCALGGVCLILMASGCAGPARREGLAVSGAGSFPARLLRPADPIARLSPAPLSAGPMSDPGSYTTAGVPQMARLGQGSGTGPAGGPLTVGGGQLAGRGDTPSAAPRGGGGGRSQGPADRPATQMARTAPPRNQDAPTDRPRRPSDAGGGLLARLNARAEEPQSTPTQAPAPIRVDRPDRVAERAEDRGVPPRSDDPNPRVVENRSPLIDPDPEDAVPILAAGIDLETYAAPPQVSADPEAQLASTRRPVSALRHAREAIRSGSAPDPAPDPEPDPAPEAEEAPEGPASRPIDAAIPDLPDVFPDDPFASDSADPFQGLEPRAPARADEAVRPSSVRPEERPTNPAPSWVDRRAVPADPSASLFEPTRLSDRLGMRMQRLRDRLTPKGLRSVEDRAAVEEGPEEAKGGFPRLFRRHRDGLDR
ncbi:hypothetical protein AB1L88_13025 [Tautonia sp. JC769]|uniref:hypothetical protein n=1 Tax=Tautonia sp. JC769 TaxID=3232135 RepID=UPI0034577434